MAMLASTGGTHTVTVVLREMRVDEARRQVPVEVDRVLCTCRIQPATSGDVERLGGTGTAVTEVYRLIAAEFPGDDLSLVLDGPMVWEVIGTPRRHRASRMTARDVVLITAQHQPREVA
ncbi:hypothetical protein CSPHI_05005 [Corynebacterium sphenisci DSM 44792]|uniref:Uncharacterized protein n=1 Tax=Corynebacterium sphenisci DSM 44792 TaxID=1437874 RepID=A0A1L7CXF5_9CORY|nr:hypothetical protein [Corynebacterium sphenisci]APT90500.1 hypothetical protein CSPHI_05005 [Corynebacterium sphenisci DSM 44792]